MFTGWKLEVGSPEVRMGDLRGNHMEHRGRRTVNTQYMVRRLDKN